MKIGVVHFGCTSAGIAQIVRSLIEERSFQDTTIYAIEWNNTSQETQLKELSKNMFNRLGSDNFLITSFPMKIWNENLSFVADELSDLDQVILLGDSLANVSELSSKLLQVPISIFNNVKGSRQTLGYDSALNSIVDRVEKVRDTANSLLYGKVRVFNVQIPGVESVRLVKDSSLAVEAEAIINVADEEIRRLKQHIKDKEASKAGYTFFMMNESVDPELLEKHFTEFDLDWKVVVIDEAQCGGPYPTALDRILTNQLKKAIVQWSISDQSSGQLLIQNNHVEFVLSSMSISN